MIFEGSNCLILRYRLKKLYDVVLISSTLIGVAPLPFWTIYWWRHSNMGPKQKLTGNKRCKNIISVCLCKLISLIAICWCHYFILMILDAMTKNVIFQRFWWWNEIGGCKELGGQRNYFAPNNKFDWSTFHYFSLFWPILNISFLWS